MTTNSDRWGWVDDSEVERAPAPVVDFPAPLRTVPAIVVVGAAGGAGASVLSVLVADAQAHAGRETQWLSLVGAQGSDAPARIIPPPDTDGGTDRWCTPAGALLQREDASPAELASALLAEQSAAGVVIDAGPVAALIHCWPIDDVHPVLVIAARPDTANRSRTGALAVLADHGALVDTTVVICCLDPWAADAVGHRFVAALEGQARAVVLWDYDPHLGLGGQIDPASLSPQTCRVIEQIAGLS